MRLLLFILALGLAGSANAQLNTVEDIDAAIQAQYQPQWAGGGDSGIRQAMRDWFAGTHPNFMGRPRYPQCIFRDELHELPIIVLGAADLPARAELPNRDDEPGDRPGSSCKNIFLATNPATAADYVESAALTRGVRFVAHEYLVPASMTPLWADRVGYWVELCYLWTAVDDLTADGMRCASQGEGPVDHNAAWHDIDLTEGP